MRLTLDTADRIASATLGEARGRSLKPVVVAVVDEGGHALVLKREEEAGFLYAEMALAKAWTAVSLRRPPKQTGESLAERGLVGSMTALSGGRFLPLAGSVLVHDADGVILGAVGVAGPSGGEQDELCAIAGIAAAGLRPGGNP